MYNLKKVQTDKERIFPWGINGNVVEVGKWNVTAIELDDNGVIIVSGTCKVTGKPGRWVIKEWVHGELVDEVAPVQAPQKQPEKPVVKK